MFGPYGHAREAWIMLVRELAPREAALAYARLCMFSSSRGMPEAKTCSDPMAMRAGCLATAKSAAALYKNCRSPARVVLCGSKEISHWQTEHVVHD